MNEKKKRLLAMAACLIGGVLLLLGCSGGGEKTTGYGEVGGEYDGQSPYVLEAHIREIGTQVERIRQEYDEKISELQEAMEKLRRENSTLRQELYDEEKDEAFSPSDNTHEDTSKPNTGTSSEYTYRETEDGVMITKYVGAQTCVEIPAALNGKRVIGLDDSAFAGTSVTSVHIPETVRTIGWFAFYECATLQKVTIPASVESIGYAAFDGCAATLRLVVPANSYAQKYAASFALSYQPLE
jgi:hypothetical protein